MFDFLRAKLEDNIGRRPTEKDRGVIEGREVEGSTDPPPRIYDFGL